MFLNCNYPNRYKVPKGKPKCLKSRMLTISKDGIVLIEKEKGTIYFRMDRSYYIGIKLDIKYNKLGVVDTFATVCNINTVMFSWIEETLNSTEEELIKAYLKIRYRRYICH